MHAVTGYGLEEFQRGGLKLWKELILPEDLGYAQDIKDDAASRGEDFIVQYRIRHKSGKSVYIEDCGSFIRSGRDGGYRMVGTMRDITAQKDAQIIVAQSNHFLQSVLDAIPDPICYRNEDGMFELVNSAMESLFGRSKVEIMGREARDFLTDEQATRLTNSDRTLLSGGADADARFEMEVAGSDGETRVFQIEKRLLMGMEGSRKGIVSVMHDITNRKRDEEKIKYLAMHDPLTGLPNRILFMDRLAQVLSHAKRSGSMAALLFIDLDNMKGINDTMGHEAGDTALMVLADRLRECLREMDTAARLGGDEFVVVLQDLGGKADIEVVATRLLERIGEPFRLAGSDYRLKVSIGISVFPDHGEGIDTLLNKADMAMYNVKKDGGRGYKYFE